MQRHIIYTFEKILFSFRLNFNNSINYHICKIQNSASQVPLRWKCFRTVWNKVFSELCILIILFFVFKYWKLWISENIFVKTITFISLHIYRTIFLFKNTKKPLFWATLFLWKNISRIGDLSIRVPPYGYGVPCATYSCESFLKLINSDVTSKKTGMELEDFSF